MKCQLAAVQMLAGSVRSSSDEPQFKTRDSSEGRSPSSHRCQRWHGMPAWRLSFAGRYCSVLLVGQTPLVFSVKEINFGRPCPIRAPSADPMSTTSWSLPRICIINKKHTNSWTSRLSQGGVQGLPGQLQQSILLQCTHFGPVRCPEYHRSTLLFFCGSCRLRWCSYCSQCQMWWTGGG